jgi:hypothetical protein
MAILAILTVLKLHIPAGFLNADVPAEREDNLF